MADHIKTGIAECKVDIELTGLLYAWGGVT